MHLLTNRSWYELNFWPPSRFSFLAGATTAPPKIPKHCTDHDTNTSQNHKARKTWWVEWMILKANCSGSRETMKTLICILKKQTLLSSANSWNISIWNLNGLSVETLAMYRQCPGLKCFACVNARTLWPFAMAKANRTHHITYNINVLRSRAIDGINLSFGSFWAPMDGSRLHRNTKIRIH